MLIYHMTDQHFPYHDRRSIQLALHALRTRTPDVLVLGGDLYDAYPCARHAPGPGAHSTFHSLQRELDMASDHLSECRSAMGKRPIYWTLGNHEVRILKYVNRAAPGLATLRSLQEQMAADAESYDVTIIPHTRGVHIGGMFFTHGTVIRKHGGMSAMAQMEAEGRSVVMGHSHRLGVHIHRSRRGVLRGYESGCLCSFDQEYAEHPPNWHHGFSMFEVADNGSHQWTPVFFDQPDPLFWMKTNGKATTASS